MRGRERSKVKYRENEKIRDILRKNREKQRKGKENEGWEKIREVG